MTEQFAIDVARNAFTIALQIGGPLLAASLAVGMLVSIFQAVTQINENTLSFVPKALGVMVVLLVAGPWMLNTLVGYTSEVAVRAAAAARLNIFTDVNEVIHQAQVVDTLLTQFRESQTATTHGNEVTHLQKVALREQLDTLAAKLDRALAAEYGIVEEDDPDGYGDRFAGWKASHQPFHWIRRTYLVRNQFWLEQIEW